MNPVHALLRLLSGINTAVLSVTKAIALVAIVVMVVAILIQVFFRYVLGNALPWPDELARFCMLWMTGLMAPVAYRVGGFVAIDMIPEMLGKRVAALLSLVLFVLSLFVLVVGVKLGYKHVNSGFLFASSSLKLPLDLIGLQSVKIKLAYMYASLWIGFLLLTSVNIELILRILIDLFDGDSNKVARIPGVSKQVLESEPETPTANGQTVTGAD